MKKIELTNGGCVLVDDADFDWLSEWNWHLHKNTGYALGKLPVGRMGHKDGVIRHMTAPVSMHRLIMSAPNGILVDHRDGNKLNNQRANLRLCSASQNVSNSISRSKTSRYKGVTLHACGKWAVYVKSNGKQKYVGIFKDEVDAATAYNFTALEYYGEFARYNLPC